MDEAEPRRSKAEPETPAWIRWLLAGAVLAAGAVAGGLAASLLPAGGLGDIVGAAVVLAAGVLAARVARLWTSPGGMAATLLLPVLVALALWLFMLPFAEGDPALDILVLRLAVAWAATLALTGTAIALRQRRADDRLRDLDWPPADRGLAEATDAGRAAHVIREYPDSQWGRARLLDERRTLAAHGYTLVELEGLGGAQQWAHAADLVSPIALVWLDSSSGPVLVASFKRGVVPGVPADGQGPPVPASAGARRSPAPSRRRRMGRRDHSRS